MIFAPSYKKILLLVLALWVVFPGKGYSQEFPLELKVKAILLKKIVKFIDWPNGAKNGAKSSITLGFLGESPVWPVFQALADQGKLGALVLKKIQKVEDGKNCMVLYVGSGRRDELREIFSQLKGRSTLTVGETDGFAEAGGMVEFYNQKGKIHFKINKAATDAAGINIRSNLLRIADVVFSN